MVFLDVLDIPIMLSPKLSLLKEFRPFHILVIITSLIILFGFSLWALGGFIYHLDKPETSHHIPNN